MKQTVKNNIMNRLLSIFLLLSVLSCSPLKEYRELPEVKSWEKEIEKFEKLDQTERYPDDAVIFAGSSSIRLWSTLAKDMAPYKVIQRGYGGAKLSDYAVYADRIFSPHKCSAMVLFIANDITGGTNDKSPAEVRKLFSLIHKTFRQDHPGVPVFYIEVTPTRSRWKAWPQIRQGNELVKEWCENHRNTYFIGTDTAFLNSSGEPKEELFISDKLHLNADGYRVWTNIIKGELDKILIK
jgi:hypothetical protein